MKFAPKYLLVDQKLVTIVGAICLLADVFSVVINTTPSEMVIDTEILLGNQTRSLEFHSIEVRVRKYWEKTSQLNGVLTITRPSFVLVLIQMNVPTAISVTKSPARVT